MIVWGGCSFINDACIASQVGTGGGRYNPSTDSWTPTSTTGAPTARLVHTAVWTGSQMIVWGGFGTTAALSTAGIYTPSTAARPPPHTSPPRRPASGPPRPAPLLPPRVGGGQEIVDGGRHQRPRHFRQWRPLQSRHQQMETDRCHRRAQCALAAHRRVDWH